MKTAFARVTEHERLYGNVYVTWFAAPEIARNAAPGQFVMLRCVDAIIRGEAPPSRADLPVDPLLPRAMSIHRLRPGANGSEWSILYDVVGRGTEWLAVRKPGDLVYCWGPLGHGYTVRSSAKHLLLVAGGIGVAPLVWLADEAVAQQKDITFILGGRSVDQIFPTPLLPREAEVVITTEDGSLGRQRLATEAFAEHLSWCEQAFACGPNAMFRAMSDAMHGASARRPVQVLLEERMGCGTGICYGCTVETRKGMRLVCRDGPKFELRDVF